MSATLALAISLLLAPAAHAGAPDSPGDDTLRALYQQGRTFRDFVGAAQRRTELWKRLSTEGRVSAPLVERARAVGGSWRILAIAEDWCGDSAYNLPYVAKLVEAVEGLELRIVDSTAGRAVMRAHRTPDGRPATPTFLLLDASWDEVGCFVERPAPLMAWYQENRTSMDTDALHAYIVDFYERDGGTSTVTDVLEMLEAAAAGRPRCGTGGS
ncbi:MAG: hypothetical protein AMXMBFR53_35160 [Gemmatimonadota bacterium]